MMDVEKILKVLQQQHSYVNEAILALERYRRGMRESYFDGSSESMIIRKLAIPPRQRRRRSNK